MLKHILRFTIAVVVLNSCKPANTEVKEEMGKFISYKDVVYGADSVEQAADVYLPRIGDKRPVIILIHGGAWELPGKYDFDALGLDTFFTFNGCAVINMNYRLAPKYKYPDNIDDIGLVMDLIRRRSATWGLDPNKVCLFGKSSGAHLALLYAYSRNADKRIKAVIDWMGPTDLTENTVLNRGLGENVTHMMGSYSSNQATWQDASPVNHLNTAVPTVIFQGSADSVIFPIQAQLLQTGLRVHGVPYMFISLQGDGHGWHPDRWLEWRDATLLWVKNFLQP